jgi:CelD/BcsL family acetyltransferase involved in cellulose biosynthesis
MFMPQTGMRFDVRVDCTEACFELPQWRQLLARDPNRHIFATPEWNRLWWEEFGDGKELCLLTMTQGGEVAAIVPLYRKVEDSRRVLRFIGGIDLTDYLGPICLLDDRSDVAKALVGWLETTATEWDEFDAHNMPVPLGFAEFLVDQVDRKGLGFHLDQEETSAVLPLPKSWDDYLASLDGKDRHELRRKRRRLERDHPDAVVRTATQETFEGDFKTFVEMHRGAEGHKGHFMRPEIATFFERVARAFLPMGWLRLDITEIGGRAVASTFGFVLDGTFYLYNSAYDPDLARLSPGLVHVSELVRKCIQEGLNVFDFLRGPERYKYQMGAEAVPLNNVRVLRGPV